MSSKALVPTQRAYQPLEFTPEQTQIIRDSFANGATDREFAVLIEIAKARRLNPLLRQIHFIKRWNGDLKREVWSCQVSIDGMRAIAQRTGLYDGQDETECIYGEKGDLLCCKTRVYRKDWQRPSVGVAHWSEYVQTTRDGNVTKFWREKPHIMLAKCSEAIALRKAFPEDLSGLYAEEEMAGGLTLETETTSASPPPVSEPRMVELEEGPPADRDYDEVLDNALSLAELDEIALELSARDLTDEERERYRQKYARRRHALTGGRAGGIAAVPAGRGAALAERMQAKRA